MLGIRRYRGASIDLWQGESRLFVRDFTATATPAGLAEADRLGHRHIVIESDALLPAQVLSIVKAYLAGERVPVAIKRITVVVPDADTYHAFQDELFGLFPDEDN
jgi:hypothetical protein